MSVEIGTHSGSFHADEVLAVAMLRQYWEPGASVVRTRDLDRLAQCDAVVDVGGVFDPSARRFDHHQADYRGSRSSAGMVLDWLESEGLVSGPAAKRLRYEVVDYVDAVDNGVRAPEGGLPCFPSIVGLFVQDLDDDRTMDDRFLDAVGLAQRIVRSVDAGLAMLRRSRQIVHAQMDHCQASGCRTIELPSYMPWKSAYFDHGGANHPTEFVLFPTEGAWRVVAIPPEAGSFANKRPLPKEWAGLTDEELERVSGIPGAKFCHKNRFIAVFETREGAIAALRGFGEAWVP